MISIDIAGSMVHDSQGSLLSALQSPFAYP